MTEIEIRPLHDQGLSRLRRDLINKHGKHKTPREAASLRLEIVEAALRPSREFVPWIIELIGGYADDCAVPVGLPDDNIPNEEITRPDAEAGRRLYERLEKVPPFVAARPSFWAAYNLALLEHEKVEGPWVFAAPPQGARDIGGRAQLAAAVSDLKGACVAEDADKPGPGRETVGILCRRLFGSSPEARGRRALYEENPMARGWWREKILREAMDDLGEETLDECEVRRMLNLSAAPWRQMTYYMGERLTILGERPVRSALVAAMFIMDMHKNSADERERRTRTLFDAVGLLAAGRNLGVLTPKEALGVVLNCAPE